MTLLLSQISHRIVTKLGRRTVAPDVSRPDAKPCSYMRASPLRAGLIPQAGSTSIVLALVRVTRPCNHAVRGSQMAQC